MAGSMESIFLSKLAVVTIKQRGNIPQNTARFTLLNNKGITTCIFGQAYQQSTQLLHATNVETYQCVSHPALKSFIQKFITENVLCNTTHVMTCRLL